MVDTCQAATLFSQVCGSLFKWVDYSTYVMQTLCQVIGLCFGLQVLT